MPLLVLFDAHALVHRAYHAITTPLAVSRTGEPTKAVYGFVQMLLKVLADVKPTHWAVAFDSPGPTFRHREYGEYKATRAKAPDDLKVQLQRVRQVVQAFSIPGHELPGYEADDILGTLARQAQEQGIPTIIVTGDSDTLQLVSPQVKVMLPRPQRPFSDTILYDEALVQEKYGVKPVLLPDLKGFTGETSDNIPGVRGVGDKTALKLVQTFGSLEAVFQHLDEVTPPKLQDNLRQHQDLAELSRNLATIVRDLPLALDHEACRIGAYDREAVAALFRELEFSSLLPRLPKSETPRRAEGLRPYTGAEAASDKAAAPSPELPRDYRIVDTAPALEELVSELASASAFVFDLETTGQDPRHTELVGLSFSTAPGRAFYVPVGHRTLEPQLPLEATLATLRRFLEDPHLPKVAHNGKWDMTVLASYGIPVAPLAFDTMVAAHLLGEKSLGLKFLAFARLNIEMTPITELIGTGRKQITMAQVDVPRAADYACADADLTGRLREVLAQGLRKEEGLASLFHDVEMPLLPVLFSMEQHGVALDVAHLAALSRALGQEMARLEQEIYADVGHQFNLNSPQQLGLVLVEELRVFEKTGVRPTRTKTGYSTDAEVLEKLRGAHPIIEKLLDYRQVMKLKSTYVDALPALLDPRTGRLHTSFNQTATATGRLSSSDPNLQNIPIRTELGRQVRRAFIAPPGCVLLSADYSQIDLRALAHLSQDPALMGAFQRDEDIHRATAAQVFGVAPAAVTPEMRRVAKTVNFGVIYGMSDYGLEQATDLTREQASAFISTYFERYAGVKEYLEATRRQARQKGYVQTILGRRRYIPEVSSTNAQVRAAAERMAINMPVQGTSADIIKLAMIDLQRRLDEAGLQSKMLLQVHDELVFEVPQEELAALQHLVADRMPQALKLTVPLKVDLKVGPNWEEMEAVA